MSLKTIACISTLLSIFVTSPGFAKTYYELADDLPVLSADAKVAIFPLDVNSLMSASEREVVEPLLITEIKKAKFSAEVIKLSGDDLAAYYGVTGSTTDNSEEFRALFGSLVKNSGLQADVVMIPEIVVSIAEMKGVVAKGDGVTFNIPTELRPGERVKQDVFDRRKNNAAQSRVGNSPMYSLRLSAFTSEGEWLFTSLGGVSFPYVAVFTSGELKERSDLLSHKDDIVALKKGVKKAFYPLRKKLKRKKR